MIPLVIATSALLLAILLVLLDLLRDVRSLLEERERSDLDEMPSNNDRQAVRDGNIIYPLRWHGSKDRAA
jgi:hypothetical protein